MLSQWIFISIAAYRDPQLVPTVLDCIAKAAHPERLRFGICWQRDLKEEALPFAADPRFRVLDIDWRESKGACWARSETMKLWNGEEWFLQVDSHCRFAKGWDETLIRMMVETGSSKPVLSTYATAFTPAERGSLKPEILEGRPMQMILQAFTAEGIPQMRPGEMPAGRTSLRPMRARFLAAGFLFTSGGFVGEVPYDPELYFMGEEAAMTLRAFTHGYDLFHPAETVIWHDYIRADARRHWGDHDSHDHDSDSKSDESQRLKKTNFTAVSWRDRDESSKRKVQRLLLGEAVEAFGLGQQRSIQDYETYAGLSFHKRVAQQFTLRGEEPPNPIAMADWTERVYPWIARVQFTKQSLPYGALLDPSVWSVSIFDEGRVEICRRDLLDEELAPFLVATQIPNANNDLAIICEFSSETAPVSWTLLPRSGSLGWLPKIGAVFAEEDFAILKEDSAENKFARA